MTVEQQPTTRQVDLSAEHHRVDDSTIGVAPNPSVSPFHNGSPASVGVPTFLAGSVALGLALIGYTSTTGSAIPIILVATGLGQLVTCIWCIGLGESVPASIFGIFGGFWLSYSALVLGLGHGWYGITKADTVHAQTMFLISWIAIIGLLLLGTLRLPLVFTALFAFVEVALALTLAGTLNASTGLLDGAGVAVFCFAGCGAIVYLDTMFQALGGKGIPLGPPVMR